MAALITINSSANEPIYRQIAAQVRRLIASGELAAGERLPTARELAAGLDINMHTVRQAFEVLASEGLVDVRRGRGVTVRSGASPQARVSELVQQLVDEAKRMGVDDAVVLASVRASLRGMP